VAKWLDGRKTDSFLGSRITEYILRHGDDISFTGYFWKRCEPIPYELDRYSKYSKVLSLFAKGRSAKEISIATRVNSFSVWSWTRFRQKPKLAHYLEAFLEFGKPRPELVWLSVNNTSGHAVPLGPFVQVPKTISEWRDVGEVVAQLKPLQSQDENVPRDYMFGFLLGMIIGDAAKSRSKNWHRHLGLVLSKKYDTNERIGEFTCTCAQSVGIRMHRVSDQPKPDSKPHGFYQWVSEASPLLDWIFNVCLGLKDGERTTYDSVRMDWVPNAPEDFRRGLLQGIAESDGSVSIASQTVEFWIGPNWDFVKRLLHTFDVKSFRNREALSVTKRQVPRLAMIPAFSPTLRTVRYQRLEKLAGAKHVPHGHRLSPEIRRFIADQGGSTVDPTGI
jgi:hypothetical protein